MSALPLLARYPSPGEVIDGKYRIVSILGEGGMGAVAKCEHLLRKVPVALKFMAPHVMAMEGGALRFLNEAVLASQIPSDHVVGIYDVGKLPNGAPYLVLEYLDGHDIATLLEENNGQGIDVTRAVHVVIQILRALQIAHAVGVVHRDLKPANVFLVEKDGEKDFVKLLDFGISKAGASAGITQTNAALGTPLYMSPEQARNPKDVDARADLYSAGVILYELLSGRTPHISESGEAPELILKLFTENPPEIASLRSELPKDLCTAIHKSLARERKDRFASAKDMAEALAPFTDERSAHVLAKIRSFVGAEKLASPIAATDVFEQMGAPPAPPPPSLVQSMPPPALAPSEALAATQSVISKSDRPPKPAPPPRSIPWVPITAILAVGLMGAAFLFSKNNTQPTTSPPPPSVSTIVQTIVPPPSATTPPPSPSATPSISVTHVATTPPPPTTSSPHGISNLRPNP